MIIGLYKCIYAILIWLLDCSDIFMIFDNFREQNLM